MEVAWWWWWLKWKFRCAMIRAIYCKLHAENGICVRRACASVDIVFAVLIHIHFVGSICTHSSSYIHTNLLCQVSECIRLEEEERNRVYTTDWHSSTSHERCFDFNFHSRMGWEVCVRETERWRCNKREMLYLLNTYTPELNKIRAPHDSDWNYITIDVMYVLLCCCWYNYAHTEWGYSYRMCAQCTGTHAHTNILFAFHVLCRIFFIFAAVFACLLLFAFPSMRIPRKKYI